MALSWPPMAQRGPEITENNLWRFEQHIGAELPADYRAFLLELNGGRTARSHRVFAMELTGHRDETTLDALHSLDDPDEDHDLAARQLYAREDLPANALRIGDDAFGSALVLILAGKHHGEVWMLDQVDGHVWKLAGSFAEFMAGLRPLDDASAGAAP